MRMWKKRAFLAATTLMLLAGQASLALARGGGGKGGSLGGSSGGSFSGGLSGGGLSGGYSSGGLGGFSFFPFFFWGGPSYGSGGIFGGLSSLIILLLLLYFGYKLLKGFRHGRSFGGSRPYGVPGPRPLPSEDFGQGPVDLNGRPITNHEELGRFAKAIAFTRENMSYYAQTFPRWDRDYLVARVRQVFFWLQDAWSRQDMSDGAEHLAPHLMAEYSQDLNAMRSRGERNMIKDPVLENGDVEFIHSHLGEDGQHFIAMIFASLVDYTLDTQGRAMSGDQEKRLYFTEFWEFVWQDEQWVLSKIYQEDALEVARLARGEEQ